MNLINLDIRMLRLADVGRRDQAASPRPRAGLAVPNPLLPCSCSGLRSSPERAIFIHEGRRLFLTTEGETVLSYARSIVGFHDEMLSQLASPDIEGHVVLGTPDLYAAFMLLLDPRGFSAKPFRAFSLS